MEKTEHCVVAIEKMDKKFKFCPDLISKEEIVPITVGRGTFTRPVLHECLKNKCVAYKFGKCLKYDNDIRYSETLDENEMKG